MAKLFFGKMDVRVLVLQICVAEDPSLDSSR